jgi:NADH-quinone oxidoreductase subunit L
MQPLTAIVLLPLLGFLANGLAGHRLGRRFVSVVGCGLPLLAFALAVGCLVELLARGAAARVESLYTWVDIGGGLFTVGIWFDRLSAVMTLIVTGVGTVIHIYSVGYMGKDAGYARYFAYLNLFLFFMLLLVLGRSLLVCFVGWEGVGLCSYLLIGFWFEDPDKARTGKKAFITNRIGDAGFLLGMFLLYHVLGTLDLDRVQALFTAGAPVAVPTELIALLLLIGATGKSAQIPLQVWLPDAMAGPTPVSALIHAATMVTAGVYLIARLHVLYAHAPLTSGLIAVLGTLTALFAATVAIVQTDIKKVLAWSTISQLGYMFLALGVGAYGAAVFHLYTHAFFKALLFLGAGSVIHALDGEQDIRRMGGLARRLPITFVTFAIATAAISGLPPFAGFFSKEAILQYAFASESGSPLLWAVGAATAGLTSFYMFRLLWLTFLTPARTPAATAHHVHESPPVMTGPLVLLALLCTVAGFMDLPRFLEPLLPAPATHASLADWGTVLLLVAVALALGGLAAAVILYRRGPERAERLAGRVPGLHRLLLGGYGVDELYERLLTRPIQWLAASVLLHDGDQLLIDGTLNGLAVLAQRAAGWLSRVQAGGLQRYVLLAGLGVAACVLWAIHHG